VKRFLAFILSVAMLASLAACKSPGKISEGELLAQAYAKMEKADSVHLNATISIAMMGTALGDMEYEIMAQKPDKTYLKMDLDIFGTGQTEPFEMLVIGDEIKFRSQFLDSLDAEYREMIEEMLAAELENPQEFENMFLELEETAEFEVIENPEGLGDEYTTYSFNLSNDKLTEMFSETLSVEEFFPIDLEELTEEEREEVLDILQAMLDSLKVTMDAVLVVNNKTAYFHSLEMDMGIEMSVPVEEETETMTFSYLINIQYLAVGTELDFPKF